MKKVPLRSKYSFGKDGTFVIGDYNRAAPFTNFFPGIAGLFGIPLWVFYVNRGQCISSLGIRSKDEAIMEFLPANKAYQLAPSQGFRTFIKIRKGKRSIFYEPFSVQGSLLDPGISNKMMITPFSLRLVEKNPALGLEVEVSYFPVPSEPFAALCRELVIRNTSRKPLDAELLDGVSIIVPHGVNNFFLKEMSRTIEAWMAVGYAVPNVPVYKLTTDPRDVAEVAFVKGANFYRAFAEAGHGGPLKVVVDPSAIFAEALDFSVPVNFLKDRSFVFPKKQVARNKTPCAFSFASARLPASGSRRFFSIIGHVFDDGDVRKLGIDLIDEKFLAKKREENQALIEGIMDRVFTASSLDSFNLYARSTYLDNCLRGGLPYSFACDGRKSVYVFSRKHGDPERDYNRFLISATYFSEGEGNYRDVNQNRRCDVFFNTLLAEKNVVDFINLIQLDGYNPLVFRGEKFIVKDQAFLSGGLSRALREKDAHKMALLLSRPFSLGEVLSHIVDNKIAMTMSLDDFIKGLLDSAVAIGDAAFGDGYWSDHWTYNTDLLESFYSLYPEKIRELIFENRIFTYFDTHVFVKPRSERYCLRHAGVRQYHALAVDEAKSSLIQKRHDDKHLVRANNGEGDVLRTVLLDKLLCLIVNKLSTLDPFGTGIEMEADKPGWYDSLNGLPGLLGSSICETFELKRLIEFLNRMFSQLDMDDSYEVAVVSETARFIEEINRLLSESLCDFDFWDRSGAVKERFRESVRRGVSGEFSPMPLARIKEFFGLALKKLDAGIAKSLDEKTGYYCTYFVNEVTRHESVTATDGRHKVEAREFCQHRLPLFLEGFVHALRTEKSRSRDIYNAVRSSPLWDSKLKMYKVNASLEKESFELGRAKAFAPGWLENESIWLHMEYKYLLELLKNGLHEEFYKEFFKVLVPFQEPRVYGRSIFENSSFIVSSAHPDASLHGRGFVARLSGSTAEFIHMWLLMNAGPEPFFLDGSRTLNLRFSPILSRRLFTKEGAKKSIRRFLEEAIEADLPPDSYSFLFLNSAVVTYLNPKKRDTFGPAAVRPLRVSLFNKGNLIVTTEGACVGSPYAGMVRDGKVDAIEVVLG